MHFILGLDIGTTGCKASIYNEKGSVCASAYREYLNLHTDGSLDAEGVWSRMREAIGVCTKGYPEIEAVCTASFGETVVCTDTRGNALSRAILYTNANAQEDWKKLDQAAGGSRIAEITGHISHPMYTISRLMWIKRNQKEVYDKTEKFLFMAGFIEKKLGGDWCAEETLAARSMAYDVRKGKWSDELCTAAGISLEKLPPVVKAGEAVGTVKEELVKYFGWKKPPVILAGGHDQPCTALGLGAVNGGDAAYGLGTAECFTLVLDAFTQSEKMQKAHLICTPHVVEHKYVTYGVLFSGNIVLSRLKEALYTGETQQEKSGGVNVYEQMMREMPETTDLLFLPHLAGTGTPQMDMDDRGVIHGLTLETKRGELVRAALEGIAFDMRRNLDNMKACGLPIGQILAAGGGARASKGLQIRSDILGEPIYVSEDVQAGTRGVFYIAAKALGWLQEYEQIKNYSECIQYRPQAEPISSYYEQKKRRYWQLYKKCCHHK